MELKFINLETGEIVIYNLNDITKEVIMDLQNKGYALLKELIPEETHEVEDSVQQVADMLNENIIDVNVFDSYDNQVNEMFDSYDNQVNEMFDAYDQQIDEAYNDYDNMLDAYVDSEIM